MTTLLLTGARVVLPDRVLTPGSVLVRDGRVVEVHDSVDPQGGPDSAVERVDLAGRWLVPGFVDMHAHGGGGASFQGGDADAARRAVGYHRSRGTTTMLASLVSRPVDELVDSVGHLAECVAEGTVAGVHLEGPFLASARCGAHDPALLRPPNTDDLDRLLDAGRRAAPPGRETAVAMMTVAPELEGGVEAVRRIAGAGVVAAVGHTDASYYTTRAAVDAGARVATHLFNAMPPMDRRTPGPVGALLEDDRVTVELITDGQHLHASMVRLVFAATGASTADGRRRVALVSDAVDAAGLGDGDYHLGGRAVVVRDGVVELADRSGSRRTLAGSTATVADCLRNSVAAAVDVLDAVNAATSTPAAVLGLGDRGMIAAGRRADLVVLDEEWRVSAVMQGGSWVSG